MLQENIKKLVEDAVNASEPGPLLSAIQQCHMIAFENYIHNDVIIATGVLPLLIQCLANENNLNLYNQAACTLAYVSPEVFDEAISLGAIPVLVKLLASPHKDIRIGALSACSQIIDGTTEQKLKLLHAGVIPAVIQNLKLPDNDICKQAIKTLGKALESTELVNAVIHAEAIVTLTELLESLDKYVYSEASKLLCKIAELIATQRNSAIMAQAIPSLIKLLESLHGKVCWQAAKALSYIAYETVAVIQVEVIPVLIQLLESSHEDICLQAVKTIGAIACRSYALKDKVVQAGVIPILIRLLKSPYDNICVQAAKTINAIAFGSYMIKHAVIQAGAIPSLMHLRKSQNLEASARAIDVLSNLGYCNTS